MRHLTLLVFIFFSAFTSAQQINPRGQFLKDSIKIGEPVGFSLALKYPRELDILFPDSLFNFSPYEFESKTYIPTRSDSVYSYDSTVYYLTTFEIDTVQYLQLPVFVLHGNDSTKVFSQNDSVIIKQLVEEVPDSVSAEAAPLIENTNYINVPLQFNYPYFIIGALLIILIVVLVIVFFGNKIRRAFILRKLKRNHRKFLEGYNSLLLKQNEPNRKLAEGILTYWKKYLEKLNNQPFTKLTTKEILNKYQVNEIENDLRSIDRAIYSQALEATLEDHYQSLREFAEKQFENRIEEVKNG